MSYWTTREIRISEKTVRRRFHKQNFTQYLLYCSYSLQSASEDIISFRSLLHKPEKSELEQILFTKELRLSLIGRHRVWIKTTEPHAKLFLLILYQVFEMMVELSPALLLVDCARLEKLYLIERTFQFLFEDLCPCKRISSLIYISQKSPNIKFNIRKFIKVLHHTKASQHHPIYDYRA